MLILKLYLCDYEKLARLKFAQQGKGEICKNKGDTKIKGFTVIHRPEF